MKLPGPQVAGHRVDPLQAQEVHEHRPHDHRVDDVLDHGGPVGLVVAEDRANEGTGIRVRRVLGDVREWAHQNSSV